MAVKPISKLQLQHFFLSSFFQDLRLHSFRPQKAISIYVDQAKNVCNSSLSCLDPENLQCILKFLKFGRHVILPKRQSKKNVDMTIHETTFYLKCFVAT